MNQTSKSREEEIYQVKDTMDKVVEEIEKEKSKININIREKLREQDCLQSELTGLTSVLDQAKREEAAKIDECDALLAELKAKNQNYRELKASNEELKLIVDRLSKEIEDCKAQTNLKVDQFFVDQNKMHKKFKEFSSILTWSRADQTMKELETEQMALTEALNDIKEFGAIGTGCDPDVEEVFNCGDAQVELDQATEDLNTTLETEKELKAETINLENKASKKEIELSMGE